IATVVSRFFTTVAEGLTLLQGAGISNERVFGRCRHSSPTQAFEALSGWLDRARERGLIAPCDIPALTVTLLGALRNWSFNAKMFDEDTSSEAADSYISMLIDLLWDGIAP
ncbi:MAG: hypothetical protein MI724_14395, partial [Spirochaetales bacterium]|nr:hypothetical protein [Spirochaetales bacterium]